MTKDPNRDEQLILAKKMEEALRERTNQITVALQQSKKEPCCGYSEERST